MQTSQAKGAIETFGSLHSLEGMTLHEWALYALCITLYVLTYPDTSTVSDFRFQSTDTTPRLAEEVKSRYPCSETLATDV